MEIIHIQANSILQDWITRFLSCCAPVSHTQTGADVLFIMNYPGYVGVPVDGVNGDDEDYQDKHPGLGFKYTSKKVPSALRRKVAAEHSFTSRRETSASKYEGCVED